MIITVLAGGIGNQLQQFAYGFTLAKEKKCRLILDAAWFRKSNKNATFPYTLPEVVDIKEHYVIKNIYISRLLRLILMCINIFSLGLLSYKKIKIESPFKAPKLPSAFNYFVSGYPNNLSFFKNYIPLITKKIKVSKKNKSSKIKIGIHIRKGDYSVDGGGSGILDFCSKKYYLRALKLILNKNKLKNKDIELIIFSSDDNNWSKENINFKNIKKKFIIGNIRSSIKDLKTMMSCSHLIIPNSTYSWWAAQYVDNINNGTIVGPDLWWDRIPAKKINIYNKNWLIAKTGFKVNKNPSYTY